MLPLSVLGEHGRIQPVRVEFDYERPNQATSAVSSVLGTSVGFVVVRGFVLDTTGFVAFAAFAGVVFFAEIAACAGFAVSVAVWEVDTFVIRMPALSNIGASVINT